MGSVAKSIRGAYPQNLVEKILRSKIYQTMYWKEQCFGLTAETLVDKAMKLNHLGDTFGSNQSTLWQPVWVSAAEGLDFLSLLSSISSGELLIFSPVNPSSVFSICRRSPSDHFLRRDSSRSGRWRATAVWIAPELKPAAPSRRLLRHRSSTPVRHDHHPPSISTRVRSRWFSVVEAWITVVPGEIDQSGHIVTAATACFSSAEIRRHHRSLASALRVLQVKRKLQH
ncbi:hypothetical protein HHK36_032070 [Tetracentron sinense]|uniref:Pre-mRNA-splicing factor 38 n=1 Tax=Tetracentron sinense TaxID=13715 RepID=A0A834YAX1_TETSI|nr:hypothetical protein HHK36_032070 [Tetracentron sinense]